MDRNVEDEGGFDNRRRVASREGGHGDGVYRGPGHLPRGVRGIATLLEARGRYPERNTLRRMLRAVRGRRQTKCRSNWYSFLIGPTSGYFGTPDPDRVLRAKKPLIA